MVSLMISMNYCTPRLNHRYSAVNCDILIRQPSISFRDTPVQVSLNLSNLPLDFLDFALDTVQDMDDQEPNDGEQVWQYFSHALFPSRLLWAWMRLLKDPHGCA